MSWTSASERASRARCPSEPGTQREVGDVGRQANLARPGTDGGEQGPRVEVGRLVGVVLDAHVLEPEDVGQLGQLENLVVAGSVGAGEEAELQSKAMVGHGPIIAGDMARPGR